MAGSFKRSLVGGLTLSGLITAIVITGGLVALAATVSTDSTEAQPGEVIEVSGSIEILDLERTVTFHWDGAGGSTIGEVSVPLLQTSYETTVTIPETATSGEHQIYACSDTCGSTTITIIVPTTTTTLPTTTTSPTTTLATTTTIATTTTLPTTTSTNPTTTTTSLASTPTTDPSSTTTTISHSTTVDSATTTTAPAPVGEATSTGRTPPSTGGGSSEDGVDSSDGGVVSTTVPDHGEDPFSDDSEGESLSLFQAPYVPPAISTFPSPTTTMPPGKEDEDDEEDEGPRYELIAAADGGGWSLDSPLVSWSAWLLVLLLASSAAATKLNSELDAEAVYFRSASGWRTISSRARMSLARFEKILRMSSNTAPKTTVGKEKPDVHLAAEAWDVVRQADEDSLHAKFSSAQEDVLQAIAIAMNSWFGYYFLLGEGNADERLVYAALGLEDGAERLRLVGEFLEDLTSIDDDIDALLRVYQKAVSGWADAFEKISAGARLDQQALAREGFARMDEASTIAEGVVLPRPGLGQHLSFSLQLSVLRDLRPPQHVKRRFLEKAKAPWRRALEAAGFALDWKTSRRRGSN